MHYYITPCVLTQTPQKRRYQHTQSYLRSHEKRVQQKLAKRAAKEREPKTYYVYMLRHRAYAKFYIGCTSKINQRIKILLRGAPQSAIAIAIRKHGEDAFEKVVLHETQDKQAASLFERATIESSNKLHLYNPEVNVPYARNTSVPRERQICICPECGARHTRRKGTSNAE